MKVRIAIALVLALAVVLGISSRHFRADGGPAAASASPHPEDAHQEAAMEQEVSDLDRPVEELFTAACEHEMPTHRCGECRYEVGVVQAPASLFAEGLLKTGNAESRLMIASLPLTGEIQFDERRVVHVSLQAESVVRRVHVGRGDKVRRGHPLFTVASAAVADAVAAHREAQGVLALARRSHERQEALRQEGISAEKELLQARQELDAAEIRADATLGALLRLGLDEETLRDPRQSGQRGELEVKAPADGTVLELHAVPGEVAGPGRILATIGDGTALWVWADLYERDLAPVAAAQSAAPLSATVTVQAYPGEEFSGTVDYLSPSLDTFSRTAKLRVSLANAEGRLLAGMFATVNLQLPGTEHALALPRDAVLQDEGRSFVFVHHHDDFYVRRPVEPGRAFGGWVEIASGLTGGESVVTDGAFLLKSDVLRSKMGAGCAD